jgi:hypothetical protein
MRCAGLVRAACLLGALGAAPTRAQQAEPSKVDLGAFTREIMILRMEGNQQQLAMWMPPEFFVEAGMAESGDPRKQVEKEVAFLRPFLTIIVQCGADDELGRTAYLSEQAVRARAELALPDGSTLSPLKNVPPKVAAALAGMKAAIAAEGDAGSNNMHVLVFPAKDRDGRTIAEAGGKGKLTLNLKPHAPFSAASFTWHTPFDALIPPVACSKCQEPLSGKWTFCPYCGTKAPAR